MAGALECPGGLLQGAQGIQALLRAPPSSWKVPYLYQKRKGLRQGRAAGATGPTLLATSPQRWLPADLGLTLPEGGHPAAGAHPFWVDRDLAGRGDPFSGDRELARGGDRVSGDRDRRGGVPGVTFDLQPLLVVLVLVLVGGLEDAGPLGHGQPLGV